MTTQFYRPKDIAAALGIGRRRATEIIVSERRVPFIRMGRAILVPKEAFEAWLAQQNRDALEVVAEVCHADAV